MTDVGRRTQMKTRFEMMMREMTAAFNAHFGGKPKMYDLSNGNIYIVSSLDFRFSTDGMWELRVDANVAGDGKNMILGSDYERQTDTLPNGEIVNYYCYTLRNVCMLRFPDMSYDGMEAAVKWIIAWFDDHDGFYYQDI